jgi:predicted polyphosphate/ATP-dependent NAD kinase
MKRVGLIVNPIAGLGGRVGLKGSDGEELQRKAIALGAVPMAVERARQALQALLAAHADLELSTYPGSMGEQSALQAGMTANVIGSVATGPTCAEDTIRAAGEMATQGVDLILFAGGDGTARDLCKAIGSEIPALGIPAGVKIQSAVFATNPRNAGELTAAFLRGETELRPAEVMDLDEQAFREGRVSAGLYGYLQVPFLQRYIQGVKAASPLTESGVHAAMAEELAGSIKPGWLYIFGPGTTTQAVAGGLGIQKTLLGVDALMDGKIVAADCSEADLLQILSGGCRAEIIVTPIGGQGCLFGRGNQPISPEVIRMVGRDQICVVSTPGKIQALQGRPLWVDTGDPLVDEMLSGYFEIITGYREYILYRVSG